MRIDVAWSIIGILALVGIANAQTIKVDGLYNHRNPGWDRGMKATMYCGNSPESWVRGDATFDPGSGILSMTIQLETDSSSAGPKGFVSAALRNAEGKTVATATTATIGRGGKGLGKAARTNLSSRVQIDKGIAAQIKSVYLEAHCVGSVNRIFNIDINYKKLKKEAFDIAVKVKSMSAG